MNKLMPGDEIKAAIVQISDDTIFLDLNSKSEGVLNAAELKDEDGNLSVKEGDIIKAYFLDDKNGEMRFTTKIASNNADKTMIENAYKNGIPVEGKVEKEIKGGYEVKIGNIRAFCPFSQMGGKRKEENETFEGRVLTFKITEYKNDGKNVLVSNRAVLEAERLSKLDALKSKLTVGMTVRGTVLSLQSFGAFVDVQGFQALLPVSEISRSRVNNPADVLTVGEEITASIIKTDWEHEKVTLSMKALLADPWDSVAERYKPEQKVSGSIARIADFGIFVNLEDGIDGLVHISTIEKAKANTNLRKLFRLGNTFDAQIVSVDAENHRIALAPASSVKQDDDSEEYLKNQDDSGETYNPFAALLKKK